MRTDWKSLLGIACIIGLVCVDPARADEMPCPAAFDLEQIESSNFPPSPLGLTILLDRSSSMRRAVKGRPASQKTTSRWEAAVQAVNALGAFLSMPSKEAASIPAWDPEGIRIQIMPEPLGTNESDKQSRLNVAPGKPVKISPQELTSNKLDLFKPPEDNQGTPLYKTLCNSLELINNPWWFLIVVSDGNDDPWTPREKNILCRAGVPISELPDPPGMKNGCPTKSNLDSEEASRLLSQYKERKIYQEYISEALRPHSSRVRIVDVGNPENQLAIDLNTKAKKAPDIINTVLIEATNSLLDAFNDDRKLAEHLEAFRALASSEQASVSSSAEFDDRALSYAALACEPLHEDSALLIQCKRLHHELTEIRGLAEKLEARVCTPEETGQQDRLVTRPPDCPEIRLNKTSKCDDLKRISLEVTQRLDTLTRQALEFAQYGGLAVEKLPTPGVVAVGDERGYRCSGVLIDRQAVLTARHCLPATHVLLGNAINESSVEIRVVDSVLAPGTADISLLRLAAPTQEPGVERRDREDPTPPLRRLRLAGFGTTRGTGQRDFGREHFLDLPGQSTWGCDARRASWAGCIPGLEMVIARTGGRDTCDGDSGGPVFELLSQGSGPSRTCKWRLIAITSRPVASARVQCGDGGVYTRVDPLAHWINETLAAWRGLTLKGIKR